VIIQLVRSLARLAAGCACIVPLLAWAGELARPPAAPIHAVVDTLHGVEVADPYRNLEDVNSPSTRDWLRAQGEHATARLARIEGRDAMARRIAELQQATGNAVRELVRLPGDRLFYLRRKADDGQFKLVMRIGAHGAEQVLVDPEQRSRATGVPHAVNHFTPSWDGRWLAYGMSAGGSEDASMHIIEVSTGKPARAPIPRVPMRAHWAPDNRHLAYTQLRRLPPGAPSTETYLDPTVFLLDVRRPAAAPRRIFGSQVQPALGLERLDFGEVMFVPGSRYVVARTTDTTLPEGKLFVAPVGALRRQSIPWRQISSFSDQITDVQWRGNTLYLSTYAGAPRGRVLTMPLDDPVLSRATVAIPEPQTGVLRGFALGPNALYAEVRSGFNTRVLRYARGEPGFDVAPASPASTFLVDDPAHVHEELWVRTSNWTEPDRLLAVTPEGRTRDTGLLPARLPAGVPALEFSEVLVPSHDGAEVPLVIVHRKGLVRDGSHPTLLVGYGAYGFTIEPRYDAGSLAWFERDGVLAYANVRGSGAFGDAWYRAGFKATKPNTWKDGIACARHLIEQRYASAGTLGIWGTSAGGIFVGRAVTSAPELFAAAIFEVGVMDAVRAEESANGITNVSEFGSARNPAEFPSLLEMSTYHQIRDGTAYPAVLLIHGLNDPRVDVWHSAKAAARLQAATSSGKPVLLRLDAQAGHGMGSTRQQRDQLRADAFSFLLWQFGKVTSNAQ